MHYGYFDDERKEFVITRPDTPKPWSNYIGNSRFGGIITNNAAGYAFYKSAAQGRLTRFQFNGVPAQYPGRFIYLRNNSTGEIWTNGWMPVCPDLHDFQYECRHGSGYTVIRSVYRSVECETVYFVPLEQLFETWKITLRNTSSDPVVLSLFPYMEPQCNWYSLDDETNMQYTQYIVQTSCEDDCIVIGHNVNMPRNIGNPANKDQKRALFFCFSGMPLHGFDSEREVFLGPYGSYRNPRAVLQGQLAGSIAAGDMPCGALQTDITLVPGEEKTFAVVFGVGEIDDAREAREQTATKEKIDTAFNVVKNFWHSRLGRFSAKTPDSAFNSMINMWAPFNNLMTFYWSRTASMVYAGERDGLGYRDTLQDIAGSSMIIPQESRERLEVMITGQVSTGGAIPVVKPFDHIPGSMSPPESYRSDDCLWLFNAVPAYVKETGDFEFYRKKLPYADTGEDTVIGHMRRAMEFNLTRSGAHGFPCGLNADWNDCIKLGETGESVFVAFQLRYAMREYIEVTKRLAMDEEAVWCEKKMEKLDSALAEHAWDGEWYLRAYRYDGLKFGSRENKEGSIFMNTQTWAVLSGHATGERARSAMAAMDRELATDFGIMLCNPPYITTDPKIALGRLFNPGMKENAGIFNHTQGWAVLAAIELGNTALAWQYMKNVLPASFNEKADIRQVEPYVVCQSTHSKYSPRYGAGRLSWLSGSAVWNYIAMTVGILGIRPHYDGLQIEPAMPPDWDGYKAVREFRGARFSISVKRKGKGNTVAVMINGKKCTGTVIPSTMFQEENTVEVTIG